jgi:hypothetical protein
MATNDKLKELVEDIRLATEEGKLKWSETAEPEEFVAVLAGANFFVKTRLVTGMDDDGDEYERPQLELHRRADDALLLTISPGPQIQWNVLKEIFASARHRALGIDDAVDEVLSALKHL